MWQSVVQPGAFHSAAGLKPAGSISISPVLLTQIKTSVLIWRGKRKERICSFRGSYGNRENGMERVSFDVGGCGFPRQCAHWLGMTRGEEMRKAPRMAERLECRISLIFRFAPPDLAPRGLPQVAGLHRAGPSATLDKAYWIVSHIIAKKRALSSVFRRPWKFPRRRARRIPACPPCSRA